MVDYKIDNISNYTQKQLENMLISLSPSRQEKIKTYKGDHFKESLLVSYNLEARLAMICEYKASDIKYRYSLNGKPHISGDYGISMSHSKGNVCYAIADSLIGIDIETLRDVSTEQLANNRFFSKDEKDWIGGNVIKFLYLWTYKEAVAKALDIPIISVLEQVECPLVVDNIDLELPLTTDEICEKESIEYDFEYNGEKMHIQQSIEKECVVSICIIDK